MGNGARIHPNIKGVDFSEEEKAYHPMSDFMGEYS
jgi:hypothetical protein